MSLERLDRIEARFALHDLVHRYCDLVDARRIDDLVELFTEDAVFSYPGGSAAGREELVRFLHTELEKYDATFHYTHGHTVDVVSAEGATGVLDAHAEHAVDGTCVIAGLRYEDVYRRLEGVWRFQSRFLRIRYFLPWHKLGSAYRHSETFQRTPRTNLRPPFSRGAAVDASCTTDR